MNCLFATKREVIMAELKLFKVNGHVEELKSKSVTIEKELQNIIEKNMQEIFRCEISCFGI